MANWTPVTRKVGEWDDNAGDCLLVVASDQQKAKIKTDMGKKAKCSWFGGPAQKVKICSDRAASTRKWAYLSTYLRCSIISCFKKIRVFFWGGGFSPSVAISLSSKVSIQIDTIERIQFHPARFGNATLLLCALYVFRTT